ncbi:MAG: hypothetical protein H0T92_23355 [Pyrinomonadaceae bacterium]|nr:hypothetical protein [Pyrinomonadaceae bacterium]
MQIEEANQAKDAAKAATNDGAAGNKDRMADATSSETLSDVEKTEEGSTKNPSGASSGERSSVPAPDGAPDTSRSGRADGSDDAGPM